MGVERGGDRDALNALLHLFLKVTASEPLFAACCTICAEGRGRGGRVEA